MAKQEPDVDTSEASEDSGQTLKVRKHRSPNYPSLDLEKSLAKASLLHAAYKRSPVPIKAAMETMEYKADSSTGQQAVAALKAFGLVDYEGGTGDKRMIRVSDRTAKVLGNHTDRAALLRESALLPPIHKEIWDRWYTDDGLAPDVTLRQYLHFDRADAKFNLESVGPFIEQFKRTIQFAKLDLSDKIPGESDTEEPAGGSNASNQGMEQAESKTKAPMQPGTREFTFPLIDGAAVLRVPHPMGKDNFDLLQAVLNAAKAALIGPQKPAEPQNQ